MTEKSNGAIERDAISQRVEEIYKRLEFIDAYSAEARAGSILAVSYILSVLAILKCLLGLSLDLCKRVYLCALILFHGGFSQSINLLLLIFKCATMLAASFSEFLLY